ncbi:transposase [Rosistilla oblonga]|uniref:transposase n=1 Tax=Rosistilla oblonga TaxID=2527990 RepID=UPI003A96F849
MTMARKNLVDPSITRWYHYISRCVRQAFLMIDGSEDRKQWIEDRLEKLTENFAISVGGFSVLNNHLHVLCRLDPDDADQWSAGEVVRRWIAVYPPKKLDFDNDKAVAGWIRQHAKKKKRVTQLRKRLKNLGWFMKSLKEPLARMANKADHCRGAFWEGRYKSIAILDTEALLATSAYIDLNPLAAGLADTPEESRYSSIKQRIDHVRCKGQLSRLRAALQGSVQASELAGSMEQDHWLVPIEDRRVKDERSRAGMLETFPLGSYLLLVENTGRMFRDGKASMDAAVKDVFCRLETSIETWQKRLDRMLHTPRLRGCFFAMGNQSVQAILADRADRKSCLASKPTA